MEGEEREGGREGKLPGGGEGGVRMFTMIHCLAGDREAKKSILLWLMAWPPILSKTTKSNRLLSFSRYQLATAFAFFIFN